MASRCLDIELSRPLPEIDVDPRRYGRIFALIRHLGKPVGQAVLPTRFVRSGDRELLRRTLLNAASEGLPRVVLERYLREDGERPASSPPPRATVAVCTRERPALLERALESIMALPDDGQEVMVIDSGPESEATATVAGRFPKVRYAREERRGLCRARNRALRAATGEVVAFTDDDAVVDPGWLRALAAGFDDRLVLAVTGLTVPAELETDAQEMHERWSPFGRGYRRVVHDAASLSPGAAGRAGAGVNMAVRRSIARLVGPFDEALDAGTPSRSGGDNDLFYRILARGYRIVYEPHALSRHSHRREWSELVEAFCGYGCGVYAAWTKQLFFERDASVLHNATSWLFKYQIPGLVRSSLRRPDAAPLELALAEIRGCLAGPGAYLAGRTESS